MSKATRPAPHGPQGPTDDIGTGDTSPPIPDNPRWLVPAYSLMAACLASGYGVLFTVVGDYRDAYAISESTVGLIIAVGFIAGALAQVFIAPIGDRGHARKLVLIGVGVNTIGLALMGFGESAATIMAGRVLAGLATGAAQPSIRRIVVLSAPDDVGRNLGRLLSAGVFGFAIGPALSAALVEPFGLAAPFLVIGVLSLCSIAATFQVPVSETVTHQQKRSLLAVDLLGSRTLAGAVILGSSVYYMLGSFDSLWDVVHGDLGTDPWLANLGITLFAIPMVFLAPKGGQLAQRIGPFRFATVGLLAAAAFMASYGLVPSGNWIFTIAMGQAITDGLTFASPGIAVAMTAPKDRQAGAQGLLGAAQALAAGTAAAVAGLLYQFTGRATAYLMSSLVMVVMVVIGLILAAPAIGKLKQQTVSTHDK